MIKDISEYQDLYSYQKLNIINDTLGIKEYSNCLRNVTLKKDGTRWVVKHINLLFDPG